MLALMLCAMVWASTGKAMAEVAGVSAPLLAWSSHGTILSAGAVYESARTERSAEQLVLGALGKLASGAGFLGDVKPDEKADLVVVYLGSQVDASALRQASKLGPLQKLSGILAKSQSSLVLPFLKYQGASLLQELRQQLQSSNLGFQTVGCFSEAKDVAAEVQEIVRLDRSLQVLLVCPPTATASGHSPEALEAEVDLLQSVQAAVERLDKHVVFVYANQAPASRAARRSLVAGNATDLSGFGEYTKCGVLCQTQVAWLQGMLALLFMVLALCSGLTCLNLLNGPSRFETAKEPSNS